MTPPQPEPSAWDRPADDRPPPAVPTEPPLPTIEPPTPMVVAYPLVVAYPPTAPYDGPPQMRYDATAVSHGTPPFVQSMSPDPQAWGESLGFTVANFRRGAVRWYRWLSLTLWVLIGVALSLPMQSYGSGPVSGNELGYTIPGWTQLLFMLAFVITMFAAFGALFATAASTVRIPAGLIIGALLGLGGLVGVVGFVVSVISDAGIPDSLVEVQTRIGAYLTLGLCLIAALVAVLEVRVGLRSPRAPR